MSILNQFTTLTEPQTPDDEQEAARDAAMIADYEASQEWGLLSFDSQLGRSAPDDMWGDTCGAL